MYILNIKYHINQINHFRQDFFSTFFAARRATLVCLVPARTDTAWWFDYCAKGEIRFIKGRLKFGGSKNAAPFPSAIIVFSPDSLFKGIVKQLDFKGRDLAKPW